MPEEQLGDKTEEPTPRRRQEARERGQVAKSPDLNAAIILLGAVMVLGMFGPAMLGRMKLFMQTTFEQAVTTEVSLSNIRHIGGRVFSAYAGIIGPFAAVVFVLAGLSNVLQSGVLFSGQPLMPQLSRLNPLSGLGRIFSRRGAVRLVVSLAKMVLMAAIIYITVRGELENFVVVSEAEFEGAAAYGMHAVFVLAVRMAVALLILGILDFAWQYFQHENELKMTRQEVRDELKRMEGDPMIRDRRKRLQRQMAMQRMMHEVPEAAVVITNPTHVSVALKYDKGMTAPVCVGKGKDLVALRIRRIAAEHDIPMVERPPLARALHDAVEVGQPIPDDFFGAVAEVMAYVYKLNQQLGRRDRAEAFV